MCYFAGLRVHSQQLRIFSLWGGVSAGGAVRGVAGRGGTADTQRAAPPLEQGHHPHRVSGHPPTPSGQHDVRAMCEVFFRVVTLSSLFGNNRIITE
jgi:hypothetical protein